MPLMIDTPAWQEHQFFQYLHRLDQIARFAPWPEETVNSTAFGRRVEVKAAHILADRGHQVSLTTHKAAVDIQAGGARVEVKGAHFHPAKPSGARYQAHIRNHRAHLFLFACLDDDDQVLAWFVIPGQDLGRRCNIAIWSRDPLTYTGLWADYLDRWDLADRIIHRAGPYPTQLPLPLSSPPAGGTEGGRAHPLETS